MLRILLLCVTAFAACSPSPQDAAMRKSSPGSDLRVEKSDEAKREVPASPTSSSAESDGGDRPPAALGPMPEPVSAAENPAPTPATAATADLPEEALGRRTLSTAFVRVGPDGHLTVELRNGRAMVLRNVTMRRRDYCGTHVVGNVSGTKYCGRYEDVLAARAGGLPTPIEPDAAAANPIEP